MRNSLAKITLILAVLSFSSICFAYAKPNERCPTQSSSEKEKGKIQSFVEVKLKALEMSSKQASKLKTEKFESELNKVGIDVERDKKSGEIMHDTVLEAINAAGEKVHSCMDEQEHLVSVKDKYEIYRKYNYCMKQGPVAPAQDGESEKDQSKRITDSYRTGLQCRTLTLYKDKATGLLTDDYFTHQFVAMQFRKDQPQRTLLWDVYYIKTKAMSGNQAIYTSYHDEVADGEVHVDHQDPNWVEVLVDLEKVASTGKEGDQGAFFPAFDAVTLIAGTQNKFKMRWKFTEEVQTVTMNPDSTKQPVLQYIKTGPYENPLFKAQ